ncbi:MAG: hypothetical protein ACRCZI_00625, partial [Cetobacterium sp.]
HMEHEKLKKDPRYNDWFEETFDYIRGADHFMYARSEKEVEIFEENCEVLKPQLAVQKKTGVDRTGETLNLIKYKQVIKGTVANGNGHQDDLRKELIFRDMEENEVDALLKNGLWWSEVLGQLMNLEVERVRDLEGSSDADIDVARKYFKPLSGAKFKPLEKQQTEKNKEKPTKRKAPLKPLDVEKPKKKKGTGRNRY